MFEKFLKTRKSTPPSFGRAINGILAVIMLSTVVALIGIAANFVFLNVHGTMIFVIPVILGVILFMIGILVARKLRNIEKVKDEFVTIAAHRFRTPLTRLQWVLSDLSTHVSDEEGMRSITLLKETLVDLTGVVNRLLDVAESDQFSSYYDYIFEHARLEPLVRQAVLDYGVGAANKRIVVSLSVGEDIPKVFIDQERIKTAIFMLLENAIVYTRENGAIEVELRRKGKNIIFSVHDNGIGIAKEAAPYIFSKFFRAREAISMDTDRAGLGLSLVKDIVEKHNGKVGFESAGRCQGSTFWFSLPIT